MYDSGFSQNSSILLFDLSVFHLQLFPSPLFLSHSSDHQGSPMDHLFSLVLCQLHNVLVACLTAWKKPVTYMLVNLQGFQELSTVHLSYKSWYLLTLFKRCLIRHNRSHYLNSRSPCLVNYPI